MLEDHSSRPHLQVLPEARSAGHIAGKAIALGPAFLEARRPRGVHLVRTDGDQQVIALRRETIFQGLEGHKGQAEQARGGLSRHRSEEHTSELQSLMSISYAGFCLKKKNTESDKHKHTT